MARSKKKTTKSKKQRQNFFPTLILVIILWGLIAFTVYFIDPSSFGVIPFFFLLLFTTLVFTISALLANTRRGIIAAIGITVFLVLRFFGIGNILNLLLITAIAITLDLYLSR